MYHNNAQVGVWMGCFADRGAADAVLCVVAVLLPPLLAADIRQKRKGLGTRGVLE